jgi:hypothetical protein
MRALLIILGSSYLSVEEDRNRCLAQFLNKNF